MKSSPSQLNYKRKRKGGYLCSLAHCYFTQRTDKMLRYLMKDRPEDPVKAKWCVYCAQYGIK